MGATGAKFLLIRQTYVEKLTKIAKNTLFAGLQPDRARPPSEKRGPGPARLTMVAQYYCSHCFKPPQQKPSWFNNVD